MKSNTFTSLRGTGFCLVVFLLAVLVSCGGPEAPKNAEKVAEKPAQEEKQPEKKVQKLEYPIPTPFEITNMLNKAGASYIIGLSNPLENIEKYITEEAKALNLGVYGADLSYAATYNQTEDTRQYLANLQKLTDELGVATTINKSIIESVENNIQNLDTLHKIISNSFYDTFDFLNQNKKAANSVLVLAGGWIEGLYISTQLTNSSEDKGEIVKGIASQKAPYNQLLVLMRAYNDKNEKVKETFTAMESLKGIFDAITPEGTLTDPQLEELKKQVEGIRKSIVE